MGFHSFGSLLAVLLPQECSGGLIPAVETNTRPSHAAMWAEAGCLSHTVRTSTFTTCHSSTCSPSARPLSASPPGHRLKHTQYRRQQRGWEPCRAQRLGLQPFHETVQSEHPAGIERSAHRGVSITSGHVSKHPGHPDDATRPLCCSWKPKTVSWDLERSCHCHRGELQAE